jgi:beta-mannosidase
MVRGNQNMIRVWGGGVYEPECFYTLCDEMGIMVWQDFMFACGVYPVFQHFMDNVQKEAEYNVERLRNHPSMTLFCGNNEDCECRTTATAVQIWVELTCPLRLLPLCRHTPIPPSSSSTTTRLTDQMILQWNMDQSGDPLPARKIYEQLLPDVVDRLTEGSVPYHRGSPYGGKGWDTADPTIGDVVSPTPLITIMPLSSPSPSSISPIQITPPSLHRL